jgi:hypothetical protein
MLGYHEGTGVHQRPKLLVDPTSVSGSGRLRFWNGNVSLRTMLFQLDTPHAPNWFGVAVPSTILDFTKPHIFFHPIPAQAGYRDQDYPTKTGMWPQLFYYMDHLGFQADAAIRYFGAPANQIVIMPFLTSAATDTGILPADWFGIITDILSEVRFTVAGTTGSHVEISEVVISSFSVGLVYSDAFRSTGKDLSPFLKQVWDFDGYPHTTRDKLVNTSRYRVIKYDQGGGVQSIHAPLARWADYPNPPPNPWDPTGPGHGGDVHHAIRDFLFLHAATLR